MKLVPSDAFEIEFEPFLREKEWKIDLVMELLDVRYGQAGVENLTTVEVEEILQYICTI